MHAKKVESRSTVKQDSYTAHVKKFARPVQACAIVMENGLKVLNKITKIVLLYSLAVSDIIC